MGVFKAQPLTQCLGRIYDPLLDITNFIPLLSAIFGTGAALGGVYLKAKLDRSDKNSEKSHESRERRLELRRAKAEELYMHLDRYYAWNYGVFMNYEFWGGWVNRWQPVQ